MPPINRSSLQKIAAHISARASRVICSFKGTKSRNKPRQKRRTSAYIVDRANATLSPQEVPKPGLSHAFVLIGGNWLNDKNPTKTLLLWGFEEWQYAFISRYFPEYKTAFARKHVTWALQRDLLASLSDYDVGFWGHNTPYETLAYATRHNINILRINDGFLRSLYPHRFRTLPLSLSIDGPTSTEPCRPYCRLQTLLHSHDLTQTPELLEAASPLRRVYCGLGLSHFPSTGLFSCHSHLGPKIRQRVIVIDAMERAASLDPLSPLTFDSMDLVLMAKRENPEADILYKQRPYAQKKPDTADLEKLRYLDKYCHILPDDIPWPAVLETADVVYTCESLLGLDALFHAKQVVTAGRPFYAGWNLTDDRSIPKQSRPLSLDQLFCVTHLVYPRYITNLHDPVAGCLAAMLRIAGQKKHRLLTKLKSRIRDDEERYIAVSEYWPFLFRRKVWATLIAKHGSSLTRLFSFPRIFGIYNGVAFRRSLACFFLGRLRGASGYTAILATLKCALSHADFDFVVNALASSLPADALTRNQAIILERAGMYSKARDLLNTLVHSAFNADETVQELPIATSKHRHAMTLAAFDIRRRDLDAAERTLNLLLLSGSSSLKVWQLLAKIAQLRLDFNSAEECCRLLNCLDPSLKEGRYLFEHADAASVAGRPYAALESMACSCLLNSRWLTRVPPGISTQGLLGALTNSVGRLPFADSFFAASDVGLFSSEGVIDRALGLIAHGRADEAEHELLSHTPTESQLESYCLCLSACFTYQGKLKAAKELITSTLPIYPTTGIHNEGLRVASLLNDNKWGFQILQSAGKFSFNINDTSERKLRLAAGDLRGGYLTFRNMRFARDLRTYLGASYVQSLDELAKGKDVIIAGFFGPGDEIRFAKFYRQFAAHLPDSRLRITCDPRLFALLKRSYPEIEFIPVRRIKSVTSQTQMRDFDNLPGKELHYLCDNEGWKVLTSADRVSLVTDLLGDVILNHSSFSQEHYLTTDESKRAHWLSSLCAKARRPLIGISWRSSLTTVARNEHYLSVEMLLPLFEHTEAQFLSFQYDDCRSELALVESLYPGRLTHVEDLDHQNDLDSVAALMKNTDLIISPATTVAELSGAVGCPTWLLSNSNELEWRKINDSGHDVWHSIMRHIEAPVKGDKLSLMNRLIQQVQDFTRQNTASK
jgi:capsular polysaccharide export protein